MGMAAFYVSELHPHRQLHDARASIHGRQLAKIARLCNVIVIGICAWRTEVWMVENVECIRPELEVQSAVWPERKGLGQSGIQVEILRSAKGVAASNLKPNRALEALTAACGSA